MPAPSANKRPRRPPARILAAMFQGGGNIPLLMPVIAHLIERGHHVRIMAGPGVRRSRLPLSSGFVRQITDAGATLVPFLEPAKHPHDDAPPLKGFIGSWAPQAFKGVAPEAQSFLWSQAWAENIAKELRERAADLLLADFVLFGALAAAEAARTPSVALMHTIAIRPLPGLPPYGTGWSPARGVVGSLRDAVGRAVFERVHRRNALPSLNAAREAVGLGPLKSAFEQYDRASRVLMLVSPSFDYPARWLPPNMKHVGTPIDDAAAQPWKPPWPREGGEKRPLILVSLSTLNQGQTPVLHRVLMALARLDVHAIVTVGPSLDPTAFVAPANVRLERFVPHSAVLPHVDALVTQCGLGTLTKGLAAGVPLVCLPLTGDQPDNAARAEAHGAGLRLPADASPGQICAALERVLIDSRFKEGAQRLSAAMLREGSATVNAVEAIESVL